MQSMQSFRGKVQHGDKRGKLLGYPTANMNVKRQIEEGVYVSKVKVDNDWKMALTFIGAAKTFNKTEVKAESFLLDFSGDLYDKMLSVQLLYKIRGTETFTFTSEKALIEQMKKDELVARQFFGKHC